MYIYRDFASSWQIDHGFWGFSYVSIITNPNWDFKHMQIIFFYICYDILFHPTKPILFPIVNYMNFNEILFPITTTKDPPSPPKKKNISLCLCVFLSISEEIRAFPVKISCFSSISIIRFLALTNSSWKMGLVGLSLSLHFY